MYPSFYVAYVAWYQCIVLATMFVYKLTDFCLWTTWYHLSYSKKLTLVSCSEWLALFVVNAIANEYVLGSITARHCSAAINDL